MAERSSGPRYNDRYFDTRIDSTEIIQHGQRLDTLSVYVVQQT